MPPAYWGGGRTQKPAPAFRVLDSVPLDSVPRKIRKPQSSGKVRPLPTVTGAWLLARRVFTERGTFPATDLGARRFFPAEKTEAGDNGVTLARTRQSEPRG